LNINIFLKKLMNLNKNLTIIIVLYNGSNVIFKCLSYLINFNIIIVDNGKNKHLLSNLKKYKNIKKIITKDKNLGFGCGVNFAFNHIRTDYFLVLNPDIIIDESSINELYKISMENNNCAISAPYIVTDKDGYGIFPEKGKNIPRDIIHEKSCELLDNLRPSGDICVNVAKGCALLINSNHFRNVGMFSNEYFLFWEEVDLCRKISHQKLSVIVSSKAVAKHNEGTSGKNNFINFLIRTFYYEKSPLYYFKVSKKSKNIYVKMLKYLFRSVSYLFILNFKKSFKNLIKLFAISSYLIFG